MGIEIKITLNEGLYLKDPQDSVLGRNIIKHSILLLSDLGFEDFNFKKHSLEIWSTDSSIYRYFENKHLVLIYLVSWYWEWVAYLFRINTLNSNDPKRKPEIIINCFVSASFENPSIDYLDKSKLHSVIIAEGIKVYRTWPLLGWFQKSIPHSSIHLFWPVIYLKCPTIIFISQSIFQG